jgi:hypothetical protein
VTQNVFISYRRNDEPGSAQALFARLEAAFPADTLFMDVTGVSAGDDFELMLREKIKSCDVLLAVIGPGWYGATPEPGKRRLDDPRDFVRIEIASALRLRSRFSLADVPAPVMRSRLRTIWLLAVAADEWWRPRRWMVGGRLCGCQAIGLTVRRPGL